MSPSVELTHDEMRALLTELGARLHAAGVEATLYIVGGAAIAFELDVRRVTADIDAVFHPETTVRAEVAAMANEKGLPQGWLNDNARAFVPGGDDDAVPFTVPGMSVALASPRHLLAMKMAAARPGQDLDDLALLFDTLGLTTPEAAADVALAVYGEGSVVLPERDELVLTARAVFDRLRPRRERPAPSGPPG
jgi:hypothetical protein